MSSFLDPRNRRHARQIPEFFLLPVLMWAAFWLATTVHHRFPLWHKGLVLLGSSVFVLATFVALVALLNRKLG